MSKHTPGPWRLLPLEDGVEYLRIRGTTLGQRYKVCNVHAALQHLPYEVLESQANARLIAAAPDLLEALRELKQLLDMALLCGLPLPMDADGPAATARAAIAKATGEQQ